MVSIESAIKAKAFELGFFACGIAAAEPVDQEHAEKYQQWIAKGYHGEMGYLERNCDKRLDPTILVPGCRSLIVVALGYYPSRMIPETEIHISCYAYGRDYHAVLKEKLFVLMSYLDELRLKIKMDKENADGQNSRIKSQRVFVDSAPILERYWAQRAGLGWIGRNHLLIIPGAGSYFFLGVLATDIKLKPDNPCRNYCGTCHRCADACPTDALSLDSSFDARRCLSYATIEQKGPISSEILPKLGNCIYGCDICQKACPWNRFAIPTDEQSLQPSEELFQLTREDWYHLNSSQYKKLFMDSAVDRVGLAGLKRTIDAVRSNEK